MTDANLIERALVLHLLRADHPPRWSRVQLERALCGVSPLAINQAIDCLSSVGVAVTSGEYVQAAAAITRMDTLDLVAV